MESPGMWKGEFVSQEIHRANNLMLLVRIRDSARISMHKVSLRNWKGKKNLSVNTLKLMSISWYFTHAYSTKVSHGLHFRGSEPEYSVSGVYFYQKWSDKSGTDWWWFLYKNLSWQTWIHWKDWYKRRGISSKSGKIPTKMGRVMWERAALAYYSTFFSSNHTAASVILQVFHVMWIITTLAEQLK